MIALFIWTFGDAIAIACVAAFILWLICAFIYAAFTSFFQHLNHTPKIKTAKCRHCGRTVTGEAAEREVCGFCQPSPRP